MGLFSGRACPPGVLKPYKLTKGSECFFRDKMIAPALPISGGLLQPKRQNTESVIVGV